MKLLRSILMLLLSLTTTLVYGQKQPVPTPTPAEADQQNIYPASERAKDLEELKQAANREKALRRKAAADYRLAGNILIITGDYAEAAERLKLSLQILQEMPSNDRDAIDTMELLAAAFSLAKRTAEADNEFRTLLSMKLGHREHRNILEGYMIHLKRSGRKKEALRIWHELHSSRRKRKARTGMIRPSSLSITQSKSLLVFCGW